MAQGKSFDNSKSMAFYVIDSHRGRRRQDFDFKVMLGRKAHRSLVARLIGPTWPDTFLAVCLAALSCSWRTILSSWAATLAGARVCPKNWWRCYRAPLMGSAHAHGLDYHHASIEDAVKDIGW